MDSLLSGCNSKQHAVPLIRSNKLQGSTVWRSNQWQRAPKICC